MRLAREAALSTTQQTCVALNPRSRSSPRLRRACKMTEPRVVYMRLSQRTSNIPEPESSRVMQKIINHIFCQDVFLVHDEAVNDEMFLRFWYQIQKSGDQDCI